jgi:hypothetical protein
MNKDVERGKRRENHALFKPSTSSLPGHCKGREFPVGATHASPLQRRGFLPKQEPRLLRSTPKDANTPLVSINGEPKGSPQKRDLATGVFARQWRYTLFLLLTLLLILGGCERTDLGTSDVLVEMEVRPDPPQLGPATILLTLEDADNEPITGAEIDVEGTMTHAGMVPVFGRATEVEPGRYEAPLEFTMGGDWIIIVRAALADGRSLEQQFPVPGVKVPDRD